MKTSTRLDLIRVSGAIGLSLALATTACGDDDGGPDVDAAVDAGPDAAPADAGPDASTSPLGTWKLTSITDSNGTVTDVEADVGGALQRVTGTLVLDPAHGDGEYASVRVVGGRTDATTLVGLAGDYVLAPTNDSLVLAGDTFAVTWTPAGVEHITLDDQQNTVTYAYRRVSYTPAETVSWSGRASVEAGVTALVHPRVAFISMVRGTGGDPVRLFEIPADVEAFLDKPLPGLAAAGDTADFTLQRTEGALGIERITFGAGGFMGLNLVVAYEDRDDDHVLGRFVVDDCVDAALDCIRGVSPIILGYRAGDSPELHTAGYGFLVQSYAPAVLVDDQRTDAPTLVSLDPSVAPPPIDVVFAANPALVTLPPALTF